MLAGMPCPCSGFVSKISYVICATVWGLRWCNFFFPPRAALLLILCLGFTLMSDQKPGEFCCRARGDEKTTQLYGDYFISHYKDPYQPTRMTHGSCHSRVLITNHMA